VCRVGLGVFFTWTVCHVLQLFAVRWTAGHHAIFLVACCRLNCSDGMKFAFPVFESSLGNLRQSFVTSLCSDMESWRHQMFVEHIRTDYWPGAKLIQLMWQNELFMTLRLSLIIVFAVSKYIISVHFKSTFRDVSKKKYHEVSKM